MGSFRSRKRKGQVEQSWYHKLGDNVCGGESKKNGELRERDKKGVDGNKLRLWFASKNPIEKLR